MVFGTRASVRSGGFSVKRSDHEGAKMEEICYKKNYLDTVMAQINLINKAEHLGSTLPKKTLDYIKANFPISEAVKGFTQQMKLSPDAVTEQERTDFIQWHFHGQNREKTLVITNQFIHIIYKQYTSYSLLRSDFIETIKSLFEDHYDQLIGRVGLRFVNIFKDTIKNPKQTNKYFNKTFIPGIFSAYEEEYTSRMLNIIEYTRPQNKTKLQYGFYNADYPSPIKRLDFVLDIDSYCDYAQEIKDVEAILDILRIDARNTFENFITDKTRGMMNG
jgi:uncharacterized protein (TIGR04255 family)